MIHLLYGQRLDRLLATWADGAFEPDDALEGPVVLAATPQVGRWARTWWARDRGVAVGWRIGGLTRYLEERVQATWARRLPTASTLELLLLEALYAPETDLPDAVRTYVDAGHPPAEADRRRIQLANRLARVLEGRASGQTPALEGWPAEVAAWGDRLLEHPTLIAWTEAFAQPATLGLPARLHLLDAFDATPALGAALARIGQVADVWIVALNPCAEFWEDLPTRRAADTLPSRSTPLLPGVESTPGENPLLAAWGRSGRRRMAELNRLADCDFTAAFGPPDVGSLLGRIQADVLFRRAPAAERSAGLADDFSVAIVRTRTVREEAERVAARIFRLMKDHPDLSARDILVALPDRDAPELRSALHAAFARHHGLEARDLDVSWVDRGRVVAAFEELLALGDDDFSARRVRRLLDFACVAYDGEDAERELVQGWIERLRIVSGRDRSARAGSYVERDLLNWEQGLRRLALGLVHRDTDRPEIGGERYVPLGSPSVEAVGRFTRWVRRLFRDVAPLRERRMPPSAWAAPLRDLVGGHLCATTDTEERERAVLFDVLDDLDGAIGSADVPFAVARQLVRARLESRRRDDPGALHRGVTIAPLSRMAGATYRACFVVGMTEAAFPRSSADGAREGADRFDFLTRLMSSTHHFEVSHAGGPDGERAPSSVVMELEGVLIHGYGVPPEAHHPPEVASPAELRRRWAEAGGRLEPARASPGEARPAGSGAAPSTVRISRGALSEFLLRPDRAWRRAVLGIVAPDDDPAEEVFRLPRPVLEEVAAEVLRGWPNLGADVMSERLRRALSDREGVHPVPVGLYGRAEARRLEHALRRWTDALWAEGAPNVPPTSLPGSTRWPRPGGGRIEVRGAPPLALRAESGALTVVYPVGLRAPRPEPWLARSFVDHVLANAERPTPTTALTLDMRGRATRIAFRAVIPDEALAWLDTACTDLWSQSHDVNFPFAVARELLAARRAGRDEDLPKILSRARALDPDAEAEGRDVPDLDRALDAASRRFDLLERSLAP